MNRFVETFGPWLVDYYAAATLLLIVATVAFRCLGQPAQRLAVAWATTAGVAALLVLCALPGWPKISWNIPATTPVVEVAAESGLESPPPAEAVTNEPLNPPALAPRADSAESMVPAVPTARTSDAPVVESSAVCNGLAWLAARGTALALVSFVVGMGLVAAWLLLGAVQTALLCHNARPASDRLRDELAAMLAPARHAPRLLVSSKLAGPIATGILRPTIILPADLAEQATSKGLGLVLAHEWAHIHNRDLWLLAAGRALLLVLFAHPVYWLLRRRVREDQETVADAAVVARASRTEYARELLDWARKIYARPAIYAAALGIWERPSSLTRRIKMVLDETRRISPECSRRWRFGALVLAGLLTVGVSMLTLRPAVSSGAEDVVKEKSLESASDNLTYHGKVTDRITGRPIAGATVTVLRRVSSRTTAFKAWKKLGETKHQTDAEGRYSFAVPPNEAAETFLYIEITARHPDYIRYYGGYSFNMVRKNEKLGERPFFENVALEPGVKISGTIVTPDEKPAAGVIVKTFSWPDRGGFEHSSWADVKTDGKGCFQVVVSKRGEAGFWIIPKDYAPSTHVLHSKRGDLGRFVLEKGLVLKGRVVDVSGTPVPKVSVNAELHGGPAKQEIDMPVVDYLARSASTDEKGEFVMAPLPAGEYNLTVTDENRGGLGPTERPLPGVFLSSLITLGPDEPTKSVEVRAVPHVLVEGHFVDSSGKPTLGFAPSVSGTSNDSPPTFWSSNTQIDNRGRFTAKAPKGLHIRLSLIDNEHHALRARVSKNAPLTNGRDVDLGVLDEDATDVTIVRYVAPILLAKAVDEEGKTIHGFEPAIKYLPDRFHEGEYVRNGRSVGHVNFERQNDGRWRTSQLLPDEEFTLTVEAPDHEPRSEKMSLAEGETKEITWRLKKLPADGPKDSRPPTDDDRAAAPKSLRVVLRDK
ncbi:MAG TPA: hypothetical protein DD670_21020 [Planctomycetaceae bacterium]|nr:hypothetical protein [Planctomycetaceae bacterium]